MRKNFVLSVLIFLLGSEAFSENLYPINDEKGGGYINKSGKIIIRQKFGFAQNFSGNFAIVQNKNLKYGIIDKKGNIVINFDYDELLNLSEDFVIYKENGKFGFINIRTKQKSKAQFDKMKQFKEGVCAVKTGNKWGFINKKGEHIVFPKYYDVSNFSEGLSAYSFSEHTTNGYINKKGKVIIKFSDNKLEPRGFREGLAPVIRSNEQSCSYINRHGKIVIDSNKISPVNVYCGSFYEGLTVFYIDQNPRKITTGFINKKGEIKYSKTFDIPKNVSEGEFSVFDDFAYNMAQFTLDYKTGFINRNFQMVIPPIYEFAKNFQHELSYVKFEDKEGYINKKGEWVWEKKREGM